MCLTRKRFPMTRFLAADTSPFAAVIYRLRASTSSSRKIQDMLFKLKAAKLAKLPYFDSLGGQSSLVCRSSFPTLPQFTLEVDAI